ncbi:hypothetical protein [[Mycobacterium] crassicus]|uniref:Uncharacterized protein n=1 Tax=[Mycobacterium] crassicus TaxID=2872309 RepID=A0ABU5XN31_9MYCO|nr:hypothetical protein [Mycolicibacter sp. MYC098]MEB3023677.1 hypothetical protein [Mycolicibacter sp. MYC098]
MSTQVFGLGHRGIAMVIMLVPSRSGLGSIVVSARPFRVRAGSADLMVTRFEWRIFL